MISSDDVIDFSKKKKKKAVKLDELLDSDVIDNKDAATNETQSTEQPVEETDELDLSNLKKKKKKKKTGFAFDDEQQSTKENGDTAAAAASIEELELPKKKKSSKAITLDEEDIAVEATDDLDELNLGKKKKKKKPALLDEKKVSFREPGDEVPEEPESSLPVGDQTWSGTDRDYTYEELLNRVFDIMRKKNPDMVAGEKKRFIMKPPQCARVGTKKTSFVNFTEICQMLHRQPKHILAFILAELGTSGSVDGNNQLIIKGRFQQKQLESVLRRYIKEYVTCHTCKSPDTILERDVRLYFLRCRVCQSRCSVAAIKSGFQAVTNKRARLRAKQNA